MSDLGNKFNENSALFDTSTSIRDGIIRIPLLKTSKRKKYKKKKIYLYTVLKILGQAREWSLENNKLHMKLI